MKMSTNRAELRVLELPGAVVPSRLTIAKRVKSPAPRIVPEGGDLFTYAITAKAGTGLWETIVFTAMALSAAGALVMAFLGF